MKNLVLFLLALTLLTGCKIKSYYREFTLTAVEVVSPHATTTTPVTNGEYADDVISFSSPTSPLVYFRKPDRLLSTISAREADALSFVKVRNNTPRRMYLCTDSALYTSPGNYCTRAYWWRTQKESWENWLDIRVKNLLKACYIIAAQRIQRELRPSMLPGDSSILRINIYPTLSFIGEMRTTEEGTMKVGIPVLCEASDSCEYILHFHIGREIAAPKGKAVLTVRKDKR